MKIMLLKHLITVVVILFNPTVTAQESTILTENYSSSIETWRKGHEAKFSSPTGWLALTGHYWLKEGTNSIGSGDQFPILLPHDLHCDANAAFVVQNGNVELLIEDSSPVRINGKGSGLYQLSLDTERDEADCPELISIAPNISLQLVRREGRLAVRVRDSQSELLTSFKGKKWFAPHPRFRVTANFIAYEQPKIIEIRNVKGTAIESRFAGQLEFEILGRKFSLQANAEPSNKLFVIFKDKTNGLSTYGGGRFLDAELSDDNKVILDFNRAYQPPCAYSPHTLCPLPPKQNHLDVAIEAGERL